MHTVQPKKYFPSIIILLIIERIQTYLTESVDFIKVRISVLYRFLFDVSYILRLIIDLYGSNRFYIQMFVSIPNISFHKMPR